jgi:hypothetical protein
MSLNGNVFPSQFRAMLTARLKEQGCENVMKSSPIWSAIFGGFEARFGVSIEQRVSSYFAPGPGMAIFGEERSGAGWRDPANFLITSAFIRVLAAWEQFEMDALKALFYHRPGGQFGPDCERIEEVVDYRLLGELSDEESMSGLTPSEPAIWGWIKRTAENCGQRRQIFRKVFKIETLPQELTPRPNRCGATCVINNVVHDRDQVTYVVIRFLVIRAFVEVDGLGRPVQDDTKVSL